MNDVRDRAMQAFQALPMVHRLTLGAVAVGLIMAVVAFSSWISTPQMTILASGLDDSNLAEVVDELEAAGIPYEIGGGGSSVLVGRDALYTTRARMATAGIATGDGQDGWEIVDDSGIAINQAQMTVNIQRALEGELSQTLSAMRGVDAATVHLVLPEERLFTEQQEPTTASVLLDTAGALGPDEVEAVVFLVSSAVEGLEPGGITVADADGTVLHAPGDTGGVSTGASRQLRQTREFEQSLAGDIQRLLTTATGSTASVVVRATLDFDETQTSERLFDPDSQVAVSEQDVQEQYVGSQPGTDGVVGVDGGPIDDGAADGATTDYERSELLREYGVSETTTTTVRAPGAVQAMSVAIVMDDGTLTGAAVPAEEDVAGLVAAAVGLDEARGDTIAVTRVAFPEATELEVGASTASTAIDMASRVGAVAVFVVVAVALFLMSRRRDEPDAFELGGGEHGQLSAGSHVRELEVDVDGQQYAVASSGERVLVADAMEVADAAALGRVTPPSRPAPPDDTARREVEELVERQPEEIANLLRGWLADAGS